MIHLSFLLCIREDRHPPACCRRSFASLFLAAGLLLPAGGLPAQTTAGLSPQSLKKLSVEELMDMEVTLVSKRPEKLSGAASAIQVVTGEDIRRSGATRLPEALRLAPNLQVAQTNSHDWAVTARGFNGAPLSNNTLADKLLVMIDGRTIYTPLFGGVFWDAQHVLPEDIDRIEVVSGPGGTLWGANAVNGVINIVTKSAKDTQGLYAAGGGGSFLQGAGAVRYGFQAGPDLFFRVYGQHTAQGATDLPDGEEGTDSWRMTQTGLRMDYYPSDASTLTIQADVYTGRENDENIRLDGQYVLGRWKRVFSNTSGLSLQLYVDRTWRNLKASGFRDELITYDLDAQYRFAAGARQYILWGVGYRHMRDDASTTFDPLLRSFQFVNGFVQDEIMLVPDVLKLIAGVKLSYNYFSGFGLQPGVRMAWTAGRAHTVWAAVSRALRSASRFDADIATGSIRGDADFDWEKVLAYSMGYRTSPAEGLSLSLAAFFHSYHDLRSVNFNPDPPPSLLFANDHRAESWGMELSANFQAAAWWRLRGGYTWLDKNVWAVSSMVYPGSDDFEGIDPKDQFLLQSVMDLPANFQADVVGRYTNALPATVLTARVPAYFTFDVRLAWQYNWLELSLIGQNLQESRHTEFGGRRIPRSIYGKVTCRLTR